MRRKEQDMTPKEIIERLAAMPPPPQGVHHVPPVELVAMAVSYTHLTLPTKA